uniref:Uncharacterized protein n=1 Tax=Anguilla anguilla TaxID=7936 RepID=A0A0E9R3I8_ANGAN
MLSLASTIGRTKMFKASTFELLSQVGQHIAMGST